MAHVRRGLVGLTATLLVAAGLGLALHWDGPAPTRAATVLPRAPEPALVVPLPAPPAPVAARAASNQGMSVAGFIVGPPADAAGPDLPPLGFAAVGDEEDAPSISASTETPAPQPAAPATAPPPPGEPALAAGFGEFVERLLPLLAKEVAEAPQDMWHQTYDAFARSIATVETGDPVYPFCGLVSLDKQWIASMRVRRTAHQSSATTRDTLVFVYHAGRWEFASGRASGQMRIVLPGDRDLTNPIEAELWDDRRIRRAAQAANRQDGPAVAARGAVGANAAP